MSAATEPDPYVILGVPRTATAAEIRAAYLALGARYHPDRHQGNPLKELASAKMAEVNRAYEILSDRKRRAAFDNAGVGRGDSSAAAARHSNSPAFG
ncbi:MAG: J domain-containing protein, partial [Deltaproteobacteria bacterium]|nr:J domain-containing protein [Deltaproteobacteria bacterium]